MNAEQKAAEEAQEQSEQQAPAAGEAQARQAVSIQIDDSDVKACYTNFCRVSSTPEELILDVGLNLNPTAPQGTIQVTDRIVMNHYTAKRLLSALSAAVQRHEQAFGVLELDIRKRVQGQ